MDFETALKDFVNGCQEIIDEDQKKNFPNIARRVLSIDPRKKYVRIVVSSSEYDRSVYCFVDKTTGDVLKSASWKAPAKGVRGNIFNPDHGLTRMGPFGAAYNR